MVIEDLDDGILQGVHVRLAVCDILLDEPPSCGHVCTANLRREECVERLGLIGCSNLSLSFLKVATGFQTLDDGGAGGRRSDTAVFALLAVILTLKDFPDFRVFDVLRDGCHVCDEGALRIGCGRGGLPFRD